MKKYLDVCERCEEKTKDNFSFDEGEIGPFCRQCFDEVHLFMLNPGLYEKKIGVVNIANDMEAVINDGLRQAWDKFHEASLSASWGPVVKPIENISWSSIQGQTMDNVFAILIQKVNECVDRVNAMKNGDS